MTARNLDLYIRDFVSITTFSPCAVMNPRPITHGHLWLAFALPLHCCWRIRRVCSADFSVLCQSGKLRSLSSNAVSGEAFQGVTPSFHSSEYQLGKAGIPPLFPLLLPPSRPLAQLKFICSNVSLHLRSRRCGRYRFRPR